MDSSLQQFRKQYLQQVSNLTYPSAKLLAHLDIQQQLYRYFFDGSNNDYLPPPEYQRKVLKRLLAGIVEANKGEDDEICDELMNCMGHLSSLPGLSDLQAAQNSRVLSYFLPDQPPAETTTSTFDIDVTSNGKPMYSADRIYIRESPQLLAAGSNVGLRTWEACLRLAYYLCTSPSAGPNLSDTNVLELGAGTGLLSLICSMGLGAANVIATDGLTHVVDGIEDNISINTEHAISPLLDQSKVPLARQLDWTDLSNLTEVLSLEGKTIELDYVLGADITYHPELLDPLASLVSLLKEQHKKCRVLISATVRNENTLRLWREACGRYSLIIREINESEDHWQCPQYRLQSGLFHEQAFPIVIMDITSTKDDSAG